MTTESQLAQAFQLQRERSLAVAHRVLGSRSGAEDVAQETWLRLSRQDVDPIDNLAGWLTTVTSRLCIDTLRSRAARPEVSIDAGLPELVVTDDRGTPEDVAVLSDSVGLALLVVLGSLRPGDRRAQREVVDAFLATSQAGDFDALLRVLDPDVTWRQHRSRWPAGGHGVDRGSGPVGRPRPARALIDDAGPGPD